jgi:hypothetical protein
MTEPRMVSIKTLSRMTDTPERTIRHWILTGYRNFPVIRLGHSVRIPLAEFEAWTKSYSSRLKTSKMEAV